MQQDWLIHEGKQDLVLYMLGWASTPNAVYHIRPIGCDVLAVHHYQSLERLRPEDFAAYRRIYLFAWSFGVWAAEQCCRDLPLYKAIALNGTPFPADKQFGMRLRVVLRTVQALARTGKEGVESHALNTERSIPEGPFPERSMQDKVEELTRLAAWSEKDSTEQLTWHKAWIGDKDEIFPPANMRVYWQRRGLGTEFSSYHYPFTDPGIVLNELNA